MVDVVNVREGLRHQAFLSVTKHELESKYLEKSRQIILQRIRE